MDVWNKKILQALELLAEKYPDDHGIRLATELRDWLNSHYERMSTEAQAGMEPG
jgi:hypothetical protein